MSTGPQPMSSHRGGQSGRDPLSPTDMSQS